MANITRFDPFKDLARFDPFRDLEDFWRVPTMRALWKGFPQEPEIRLEVAEDDKAYRVKADVPGVKKEDIKVSIDGNQISISAEVKKEKEEKKGETVVRSERYYGTQYRSFSLGHDIDEGKAEAKCEDGVLELTLPKKETTHAKQLTVK
ncbi:MAG TPA: Hsp20/alpha crystallin family protein [Casimicrobiaceae bacterium]